MVDFTSLPPELLLHIFFEVQRKDSTHASPYARLCVISRVCRSWRVAQTALWHTVAPRLRVRQGGTRTSAEQLLNALERLTARGSNLPRTVLALELILGVEARDCGVNTLTRHSNMDTLVTLICLMPNLRTLRLRLHEPTESATMLYEIATIGSSSVRSLSQHHLAKLAQHQTVRSLAVDALLHVTDPPLVAQLARVWPHLAHISLTQRAGADAHDGALDILALAPTLKDLTYLGHPYVGQFDHDGLDVCALSFDKPIDLARLAPLSHCLRSLHLGCLPPHISNEQSVALRGFTRLERVALGDVPPSALTRILQALPACVRHVALIRTASPHSGESLACEPMLAILQAHAPTPGTLRLSLVEDDSKHWHSYSASWRPLIVYCKEKGLDAEIRTEVCCQRLLGL